MNLPSEKQEREAIAKKFGNHLKNIREAKNISAAELCRRTFMEKSNLSRMEHGKVNPTLYMVSKLAAGLNISIEEFFKNFDLKS